MDTAQLIEYVRKLRKMTDSTSSSSTHPKEMLGKHLQDRMISAASNLQEALRVKKVNNGDTEEDGAEHINNYVDVKKYKPPDLLKYTRFCMDWPIIDKNKKWTL